MAMPVLEWVTLEVDSLNPAGVGPAAEPAPSGALLADVRLGAPVPNPAWHGTSLALTDRAGRPLAPERVAGARPMLGIFDPQGRCVRRLAAGRAAWRWDLRDQAGRSVPAGIYLARLEGAGEASPALQRAVVVLR